MAEALEENKSLNPWLACLPTMASAFMFVLDETIANVALPHMAGSFSVSREESMWILTSYLIASGIVIPMAFLTKMHNSKDLVWCCFPDSTLKDLNVTDAGCATS